MQWINSANLGRRVFVAMHVMHVLRLSIVTYLLRQEQLDARRGEASDDVLPSVKMRQ